MRGDICAVTGGAGFIGSNLTERLLKEGWRVRVIDNFMTGSHLNLLELEQRFGQRLELIEADIRDAESLARAFAASSYVFHQAALPSVVRSVQDPALSNDININGTLNVLLAARKARVRRVIYASSSSVYGDTVELPKKESMPANPVSPYGLTKYVGECYCRLFYHLYGLQTVSLRYFNVFGPRQDPSSEYAAVIPRFINRLLEKRSPIIYGDGEQTRDFTYVENVVDANLLACEVEKAAGECFNIACGQPLNLKQLLSALNAILGTDITPEHAPPRPGDIRHSYADITKAQQILGYQPSISFTRGLERTVQWYLKDKGARDQEPEARS